MVMMTQPDIKDLHLAKLLLEHPGMAARITDTLGTPVEKGLELLPPRWRRRIERVTHEALRRGLGVAIQTLGEYDPADPPGDGAHRWMAALSGGVGGAFGLGALAVELPVTTTIMLRSIAQIAANEGENLESLETRLHCVSVFALGGRTHQDDAAESGYYMVRLAMARAVTEAASHIAQRGLAEESAPAIVRFIARVASRFGVAVSQKAAAMAVPIVGAAGGAAVNAIFMEHFQNVAHGHFIVRRLERKYDEETVRQSYVIL